MTLDAFGKIVSKRFYWDQATVLRQVNVLPTSLFCRANNSEVKLPIADMSKVDAYETFNMEHQSEPVQQEQQPVVNNQREYNIFNQAPEEFRPSSRVLSRPGGNTHDIFNNDEQVPPSGKRMNSNVSKGSLNLYDDSPVEMAPVNRRDPNWSNPEVEHRTGRRQSTGVPNATHFSIGEQEEEIVELHPGKRQGSNGNQSHFQLSGEQNEVESRPHGKKHPETYTNTSHFSLSQEFEEKVTIKSHRRNPNAETISVVERPSSRYF